MNDWVANLVKTTEDEYWITGKMGSFSWHREVEAVFQRATSRDAVMLHVERLVANEVGLVDAAISADSWDAGYTPEDDYEDAPGAPVAPKDE